MSENTQPMTFGEKACGVSFNPGGSMEVAVMKQLYAGLVDALHKRREEATDPEVKRMLSIAITETQTAQMWAVKAITWAH
jgi:streptogramin lyase